MLKHLVWIFTIILLMNFAYSAPLPPQGTNPYYDALFRDWLNGTIDTTRSGALIIGLNSSFYNLNVSNQLLILGIIFTGNAGRFIVNALIRGFSCIKYLTTNSLYIFNKGGVT